MAFHCLSISICPGRTFFAIVSNLWLDFVFLLLLGGLAAQAANSNANSSSNAYAGVSTGNNSPSYNFSRNENTVPRQAPAAFAPGLIVGPEVCAQSISIGASSPVGGLSFGTTVMDEGCDARVTARMLAAMGQHEAALAIMCQLPRVRAAMQEIGTPCPGSPGYDPGPLAERIQRSRMKAAGIEPDPYFYDSKGRIYEARQFRSEKEAKKLGAIRSATGEWVILLSVDPNGG